MCRDACKISQSISPSNFRKRKKTGQNLTICLFPHFDTVSHNWTSTLNRPFAQLWPGDEVRGIAGEIRLRCVCFSLEHSFFFCFGMSFSDHCCVPRFFNRGRASPSLFSHGFERSSELRKYWLLAIRQADWSHFRVPNNTVVCIEHVLPATNFRFHARAVEPVDSSITSSLKPSKTWHFPKAGAVPSVFSFHPHHGSQVRVRST